MTLHYSLISECLCHSATDDSSRAASEKTCVQCTERCRLSQWHCAAYSARCIVRCHLAGDTGSLKQATHDVDHLSLTDSFNLSQSENRLIWDDPPADSPAMQVNELSTSSGATSTQLLLQLVETDMLLGLAVHQLTASIPDSYPGAQAAREAAFKLSKSALLELSQSSISLHRLPLPAPYTGPQLALQIMPSPLGPPAPAALQQVQHQPQCYTVTPTAQLLTELLPLLTSYCLARVQQQHDQHKLQAELQQELQQAAMGEQVQGVYVEQLVGLGQPAKILVPDCVQECMQHACTLLSCAVVPDPNLTAAEVQAATSAADASLDDGIVPYRCVLHAPAAAMHYASGVVCLCEALLRDAAAASDAAAQLHADRRWAAAAGLDAAKAKKGAAACISAAENLFSQTAAAVAKLVGHEVHGQPPHHPSALALAALSAGPGSDLQQQLFSLLRTMVKLGHAPVPLEASNRNAKRSADARVSLVRAAGNTAAALVACGKGAVVPRPVLAESALPARQSRDSHSAVTSKLPGLVILGSCCMAWAQQLQTPTKPTQQPPPGVSAEALSLLAALSALVGSPVDQPEPDNGAPKPHVGEHVLPPVQQWLQASSTQEQLVAAGYAPQALPQQLQQVVAALQAVRDDAGSSQSDADRSSAVQQLQAAGSALCSFAVPCLCNNPSCTNLSGLTELGLVSGRSCICGGCRVARYCGRACQRAMWKQHKPSCAALAAAAALSLTVTAASAGAAGPPAASP